MSAGTVTTTAPKQKLAQDEHPNQATVEAKTRKHPTLDILAQDATNARTRR